MREIRPSLISLIAGASVPTLYVATLSILEGENPGIRGLGGILLIGFITVWGAFLVVWPAHLIVRWRGWPDFAGITFVIAISALAGMLMLLPISDTIPWLGVAFAVATAAIWLALYYLPRLLNRHKRTRSSPRG